ncbi:hypothetical protein [Flavilitoribacter nigricans]|uniref:Uncharacterized protein n=1 Tax=Flavilitoribacter nigricans (strain ATCC 23147 / DSM 23189 / NBRC 102662 / NCIMB 1420 / SS-2) TaxID=1122177 RepID=A0A2D0MYN3_FLAN2|nr:hypothetical protein [Flavilitoribacter nigricans]PHN01290.1 hypothetical protein CRP01_38070 [Flavilitoribacter nigricans DSM 23189 = NBRC 102662]
MIGILKIGNWKTEIGKIQILPILDTHLIEEELRLIFEVYKEDEDDFGIDFTLSHIKMPKEIHYQNDYDGEYELNKSEIGFNVIWYNEVEYEINELKLSFQADEKRLTGTGRAENKNGELDFKFDSEYEIEELQIWKLDAKTKKERQTQNLERLIDLLQQLGDEKKCTAYKNAVPFVHIPEELIAQWDGLHQPEKKYFDEYYTKNEKEKLERFNDQINNTYKLFGSNKYVRIRM